MFSSTIRKGGFAERETAEILVGRRMVRLSNTEPFLLLFDPLQLGEAQLSLLRTLLQAESEESKVLLAEWVAKGAMVAVPVPDSDLELEIVVGGLGGSHLDALELSQMEQFRLALTGGRLALVSGMALVHPIEVLERDLGSTYRAEVTLRPGIWEFALGCRVAPEENDSAAQILLAALPGRG